MPRLLAGQTELLAKKATRQFIEAFYLTATGKQLRRDQNDYSEAVSRAGGYTPEDNAGVYADLLDAYLRPVTIDQASRELGCTPQVLREALAPTAEGRLAALADPTDPLPIPRKSWAADYYTQALTLLTLYRQKDPR